MVKKRVHELAKELNIESRDILKGMSRLGINLKSHMSTLEDKDIELFMKNYKKTGDQGIAEPAGERRDPPATETAAVPTAAPAAEPKASTEKQPAKNQDKPHQGQVQDDKRKQDRREHKYDRGPGLVDRVPSRPPDRRFEDRSARTFPPKRAAQPKPGTSPHRTEAGVQPAVTQPPVDRAEGEQLKPRTADIQTAAVKEGHRYPERAKPVPEQTRDKRSEQPRGAVTPAERDRKSQPRPAADRELQQRGAHTGDRRHDQPRTGGDRPVGDRPRPPRMGDGRPAGGAPAGRAGIGKGHPGGHRPGFSGDGRPRPAGGGPLKVPKVPEQAMGTDKIKASEKSRARLQQAQAKGHGKGRDKTRFSEDAEARVMRATPGKKKGAQQKARPEPRALPPQEKKPVVIGETATVHELAEKMKKSPVELIKKLMSLGIMATINQEIDSDTATILASEFGFEVEIKIELDAEAQLEQEEEDRAEDLQPRAAIVTVMGHVDHGKTSLLDAIRETNVIATEAGGITQHIGAYQVEHNNKKITFVDTPGHEAFTAMRARGAQVTDIAVLVVSADDGVMPQTIEAINHAKAAGVPIIVAINKMDKPDANPDRVKQQLTEHELVPEEWGGDTICVNVSAKEKQGIEDLLENILLVAEVSELSANPDRAARGTVIEAELDKGRGPVARVLVQKGTLHIGDAVVAGTAFGRVRAMIDDKGRRVKKAGPSTPVEVLGFHEVPQAGDYFYVVKDEKTVRQIIDKRTARKRQEELKAGAGRVSLDDLFKQIKEGQVKELNVIVKADVQGSVEAINQSLEKLSTDEVKVKSIHGGVGAISESDIMLATASNAIVIGFNVRPDPNARKAAENENVDIRLYRVIYDAIDDIKAAMSGLLEPELREVILGRVEVRKVFKASKLGNIAGCYVIEGKITRDAGVRLIRDGVVIYEGKLDSLKRFKDDAKEVLAGYECGLTLENFQDIREGDTIEAFTTEQVKRELA